MNENAFFAIKGTGANIKIKCGFVPAKVTVINLTDANKPALTWYRGMADASAIKSQNSGRTVITTLGITPKGDANTPTEEQGFTIGADATVNVATNDLIVEVSRGGAGNQF